MVRTVKSSREDIAERDFRFAIRVDGTFWKSRVLREHRSALRDVAPDKLNEMRNARVLEIAVDTVERALAAERGGAHRIELCADLSVGGLTPDVEMMRTARELVRLPIFAMVRPRGGDFAYSDLEFTDMDRNVQAARELGMDGVVLGILNAAGHVDVGRMRLLVQRARPLPVTFHRAFDVSADLRQSLERVIETGAARILSSGGASTAPEGLACLADLMKLAEGRIAIMPGSGITAANARSVAETTGAQEFHAGLSTVTTGDDRDESKFEDQVRRLVGALAVSGSNKR
jgi:copper homeostasis protein